MACCQGGKHRSTTSQLKLVDLPTDALLCIFKCCDSVSLRNLSVTCKRLNDVISEDSVWIVQSKTRVITSQLTHEINQRSFSKLKAKEKCRISQNWKYGCYKEKVHYNNAKYMPWIQLERRVLWVSHGRTILGVERLREGLRMQSPLYTIQSSHTDDISRFVKTNDFIFTGGKDKLICGWSTGQNKSILCQSSLHSQGIQGLDCKRNILVSGSKDSTIKVWQLAEDFCSLECGQTVRVFDRVWSVAIDPSLSCVATGTAGYRGIHPLHLFDLDRGVERPMTTSAMKNGAAVFDIHWECPNTLLTCGFDTILRLWDVRVGKCVGFWADPFGAAGYCLSTDQSYSVFCGTAHHGRAQLWDKRCSTSVQAYFGRSVASSPVYSLSFDPCHLFIAQDSSLNVLDFSLYPSADSRRADYRLLLDQQDVYDL